MNVESKTEVVVQAFSTYITPQWEYFCGADTKAGALDYVKRAPHLMLRVMERTVVTITSDWTEVKR